MTNIKQNQIIHAPEKRANPITGFPRDLNSPVGTNALPQVQESRELIESTEELVIDSPGEASVIAPVPPPVPKLLSIKSQTITAKPDGRFAVDVVLEVDGTTTEYEIRVTKT